MVARHVGRAGGGDRGLAAFRGKFAGIYRAYQDFLLRGGRPREAYEIYERSRAQALLALLQLLLSPLGLGDVAVDADRAAVLGAELADRQPAAVG